MNNHDIFSRLLHYDASQAAKSPSNSTVFLSPATPLLGHGSSLCSADLVGLTVAEQVAAMFEHARSAGLPPVVMGAIPFWEESPAALVVPHVLKRPTSTSLEQLRATPPLEQAPSTAESVGADTGEQAFQARVKRVLEMIDAGFVDKLVLSRDLQLRAHSKIDVGSVLHRLLARHPQSYVFSVPQRLAKRGATGVFLGASPELLVSRHGDRVCASPLAGSAPVDPDPARNSAQIAALKSSQKDLHEHAFTAAAVCEALKPFCNDIQCPVAPEVMCAGPVYHLASAISARLKSGNTSSIELAQALHPTPAVGGVPTWDAAGRIRALEGRPRDFYAGMVGWCDEDGNGEWAVSLRCAEVDGHYARLFSGAGIVAGSCPEAEFAETETKLKPMLSALGLQLNTPTLEASNDAI